MKHIYNILIIFALLFYTSVDAQPNNDYHHDKIIVKIKAEFANQCQSNTIKIPSLQTFLAHSKVNKIQKTFQNNQTIHSKLQQQNSNAIDLSNIYYFQLSEGADIPQLLKKLRTFPFVQYAEPNYINRLTYTPNDSMNGSQWYLYAVKAFQAWDVEKGDSSVVIGITDTGIDTAHEDLKHNIAYNYNDPINGIDDDHDGYIDNYYGWNTGDDNNNIQTGSIGHGANVTGIAAASTDNVTGISGSGFNCRFLMIKIDDSQGSLSGAYEGIVYAADHGASIINCSWGSFSYSEFAQDIINYASINKDALMVCAAGNGRFLGPNAGIGIETQFYPAAYQNVLSVGSLIPRDTVKSSSDYGYWLDIFAPGQSMTTTNSAGGYGSNSGTSMAAPLVAGGAALVKAHFPSYTNKQIALQLKNTADNIDAINESKYSNKLGSGRINFYRALTENNKPGIMMENLQISDRNDGNYIGGDSLFISANFINYLKSANNVSISLQSVDNKLSAIQSNISIATLENGDTLKNKQNPFIFKIPNGLSLNEKAGFRVIITANNYQTTDFFEVSVNNDFITIEENNLRISYSSGAGIGFSLGLGEGIKYKKGNSLLYEGSFIIGVNNQKVIDNFRAVNQDDNEFISTNSIKQTKPKKADIELKATFKDRAAPSNFSIESQYFIFKQKLPNTSFYQYRIQNRSGNTLDSLFAGLIMDWDINNYDHNKVGYDSARKMSISYATDSNIYCGIKVLNTKLTNFHYALDNIPGGGGGINSIDGLDEAEKYHALSQMKDSAGITNPMGNDIIDVISVGPKNLKADSSYVIAFAIIISNNLDSLKTEADSAQAIYTQLSLNIKENTINKSASFPKIYPNPSSQNVIVEFEVPAASRLSLHIYDSRGRLVYKKEETQYSKGIHQLPLKLNNYQSGYYILKINGADFNYEGKIIIAH